MSSTDANDPQTDSLPSSSGLVVFLSGDLIFASRVQAAATAAGRSFRLGGNLPTDLPPPVSHVIVDLSTRSKIVDGLMALCQTHYPQATVIAYAPHVQVERIRDARKHEIPTVLTRGQFNEALSSLF
ncbi:histidine kinase [Allorhodopirellula solitaria]|uniref:Response regulatory domain-containing protein n=1 Tax=Allorhodopirellula solitaria TaxID=2527987 RepID=A0A5C5YEB1_9BACT|nr:histidine kinase [Allorhodopirellula solitaria]TWT74087.1 hypothetical protein CA85_09730 [Allorhodopirellula solitaria]